MAPINATTDQGGGDYAEAGHTIFYRFCPSYVLKYQTGFFASSVLISSMPFRCYRQHRPFLSAAPGAHPSLTPLAISLTRLIFACMAADGIQYGWALQLSFAHPVRSSDLILLLSLSFSQHFVIIPLPSSYCVECWILMKGSRRGGEVVEEDPGGGQREGNGRKRRRAAEEKNGGSGGLEEEQGSSSSFKLNNLT